MIDASIPYASAVIVKHHEHGAYEILDDGGLSGSAIHTIEYDGRVGRYAERGGCERELTTDDDRLINPKTMDWLDYEARLGRFETKGAGKMEDCTYWGQEGPLSRSEIEEDMARCGGCMFRSTVAVDRRYAELIGITSKQDFERLLRNTWVENVMQWGITDNPFDVHWHACYHTDADHSIHVHVVTYFENADIKEKEQITAQATRLGKEAIYREAYRYPSLERYKTKDYLRQYLICQLKTELGIKPTPQELRLLRQYEQACGETRSLDARLSIDESKKAGELMDSVKQLYSEGSGRVARNYKLQSRVLDVIKYIRSKSDFFDAAYKDYRALIEQQADIKGLGISEEKNDEYELNEEMDVTAKAIIQHERDRFIDKEMKSLTRRLYNPLIRTLDPERVKRDLLKEPRQQIKTGLIKEAISKDNPLRLSAEDQKAIKDLLSKETVDYHAAKLITDKMLSSDVVKDRIDRAYQDSGAKDNMTRDEFADRIVVSIKNEVQWRLDTGIHVVPRVSNDLSYAINNDIRNQIFNAATRRDGIALGLTKVEHSKLLSAINEAASFAPKDATLANPKFAQVVDQIKETIITSPVIEKKIDFAVLRNADKFDINPERLKTAISDRVSKMIDRGIVTGIKDIKNEQSIFEHSRHSAKAHGQNAKQQDVAEQTKKVEAGSETLSQSMSYGALAASLVDLAVRGLMREDRRSHSHKHERNTVEQEMKIRL